MIKRCTKCFVDKDESEFNWKKKNVRRSAMCAECHKEYRDAHYRENRQKRILQAGERASKWRKINQDFIVDYLSTHPCVDCGETDILVLEFDHIEQRLQSPSTDCVVSYLYCSREKLIEEIAKCVVRCANCHKRRTALQMNSYRLKYMQNAKVAD